MDDKPIITITTNPRNESGPSSERHHGYSNQGIQLNLTVTHELLKRMRRRGWPLSIHRSSTMTPH